MYILGFICDLSTLGFRTEQLWLLSYSTSCLFFGRSEQGSNNCFINDPAWYTQWCSSFGPKKTFFIQTFQSGISLTPSWNVNKYRQSPSWKIYFPTLHSAVHHRVMDSGLGFGDWQTWVQVPILSFFDD